MTDIDQAPRRFGLTARRLSILDSQPALHAGQENQELVDAMTTPRWTDISSVSEPPKSHQTMVFVTEIHRADSYKRSDGERRSRCPITNYEISRDSRIKEWLATDANKTYLTYEDPRSSNNRRTTFHPGEKRTNGGSIRSLKCMYGRENYDGKLTELWDSDRQDLFKYPNKGKRVMLLISAIFPYMIVSYTQDHRAKGRVLVLIFAKGCLDHTIIGTQQFSRFPTMC